MDTIATLSNSLDFLSKLLRTLEKVGVSAEHLHMPVNNRVARQNLAAYLKAGCPRLDTSLPFMPKGTIVRHVKVDRTRTPQEVIAATGKEQLFAAVHKDALETLPHGNGDEVDVFFIPLERETSVDEIEALLTQYDLVSDPRAQAAVNEAEASFAKDHPNITQWDKSGKLVFDDRFVRCYSYTRGCLSRFWWVAGVRAHG